MPNTLSAPHFPTHAARPTQRRALSAAARCAVLHAVSLARLLAGLLAVLLAALFPARALGTQPAQPASPLEVVASILPLADFAREVGGARVHVTILVRPGRSPHSFALTPSQATALHHAELLVLNGLGLEFWADAIVAALDPRRTRVLSLGEQLSLLPVRGPLPPVREERERGEEDGHVHGGDAHGSIDPHVWLDPVLAMEMVAHIRDALIQARPQWAEEFRHRALLYLSDLAELDREYRHRLDALPRRTFIAFHAGYGHLAARYGLEQVPILKGAGDMEPSPARVAEVIRAARRLKVRAIFTEPQYPPRAARLVAEEADAELAVLDALGQSEGSTYLELMRGNLARLEQALR